MNDNQERNLMIEEMEYRLTMARLNAEEAKAYADMRREVIEIILNRKLGESNEHNK